MQIDYKPYKPAKCKSRSKRSWPLSVDLLSEFLDLLNSYETADDTNFKIMYGVVGFL